MNAYVLTGLAMCVIVLLALGGTAYLAVFFNRRAKADLALALAPLADSLDGEMNLEEAEVKGQWQGYHAAARMANASEGPGRVFQVEVLDAAGGVSWVHTSNQHARTEQPPTVVFTGPDALREVVRAAIDGRILEILDPNRERFRVEYQRAQGVVRLVRSIRSRREIPDRVAFERQLDLLTHLAGMNRPMMEALPVTDAPGEPVP